MGHELVERDVRPRGALRYELRAVADAHDAAAVEHRLELVVRHVAVHVAHGPGRAVRYEERPPAAPREVVERLRREVRRVHGDPGVLQARDRPFPKLSEAVARGAAAAQGVVAVPREAGHLDAVLAHRVNHVERPLERGARLHGEHGGHLAGPQHVRYPARVRHLLHAVRVLPHLLPEVRDGRGVEAQRVRDPLPVGHPHGKALGVRQALRAFEVDLAVALREVAVARDGRPRPVRLPVVHAKHVHRVAVQVERLRAAKVAHGVHMRRLRARDGVRGALAHGDPGGGIRR